jgi:predicted small metal-binding protein
MRRDEKSRLRPKGQKRNARLYSVERQNMKRRLDMAKTLRCSDTGKKCNWVGRAETEEELLEKAGKHVQEVHGEKVTPELVEMARGLIRDE